MINITISIYIKERCLSVCLFGFGAQTTGWIPAKFGMGHPLVPVGNLKILFWVDTPPPRKGIILEKLKIPNFPHMAHMEGGIFSRHYLPYLTSNSKVYSLARVLFSKIYNFYLYNFLILIILPFFIFEQEFMGILKRFFSKTLR